MKIISISAIGRRRRKIVLENGETFSLSARDVRLFSLREEADIDDDTTEQIRKQLRSDCMQRCGRLLAAGDYTEARLTQKLREDLYPEEIIRAAARELREAGYLDEERYAAYYLQIHAGDRSRARIRRDLAARGVPESVIDRVMAEEDDETALEAEIRQIGKFLERHGGRGAGLSLPEEMKLRDRLYRKGYSGEAVRAAMSAWKETRADDEVDNSFPHV